jgi:hypothetical protein
VRVAVRDVTPTTFMRVVGIQSFDAQAQAAAGMLRVTRFGGPFLICGVDDGLPTPLLHDDGSDPWEWPINTAAIGTEFSIWGNDIKAQDCGDPSSSFRGELSDEEFDFDPGEEWEVDTGNSNGPVLDRVSELCASADLNAGTCVLAIPICWAGNGQPGNGFAMYCSRLGAFRITHVANHDIDAVFVGGMAIADAEASGPPGGNGEAVVIRLVE